MVTNIGILGIGAYLPERVMANAEWSEYFETSDEWIVSRTGIRERRIAADDESTVDLSIAAAEAALADAGLTATDIDEIIIATDTPEAFFPDTAAFVQARLGARQVPAYDLAGSGCAGFVLGLDLARTRAAPGRNVLLVGVDMIPRVMDWHDRNVAVLFGDGAAAVVVGPGDPATEILAVTAGTDGTKVEVLYRMAGGTHTPITAEMAAGGEHLRVTMDGRRLFREAVAHMVQASEEVMVKAEVTPGDVALVVPHQANLRIVEAVRKALGLPEEKVFVNLDQYGNTGSAAVAVALWDARRQGRIHAGDLVLLTAFGSGLHWAAALLRF